jgi:hypothetical protein
MITLIILKTITLYLFSLSMRTKIPRSVCVALLFRTSYHVYPVSNRVPFSMLLYYPVDDIWFICNLCSFASDYMAESFGMNDLLKRALNAAQKKAIFLLKTSKEHNILLKQV